MLKRLKICLAATLLLLVIAERSSMAEPPAPPRGPDHANKDRRPDGPPPFVQNDSLLKQAFEKHDPAIKKMIKEQLDKSGPEGLKEPAFREKLEKALKTSQETNCSDCKQVTSPTGTACSQQPNTVCKEYIEQLKKIAEQSCKNKPGAPQVTPSDIRPRQFPDDPEQKEKLKKRIASKIRSMPCPKPDQDDMSPDDMLEKFSRPPGKGRPGESIELDSEIKDELQELIEKKMEKCAKNKKPKRNQNNPQMSNPMGMMGGGMGMMGGGMGMMGGGMGMMGGGMGMMGGGMGMMGGYNSPYMNSGYSMSGYYNPYMNSGSSAYGYSSIYYNPYSSSNYNSRYSLGGGAIRGF